MLLSEAGRANDRAQDMQSSMDIAFRAASQPAKPAKPAKHCKHCKQWKSRRPPKASQVATGIAACAACAASWAACPCTPRLPGMASISARGAGLVGYSAPSFIDLVQQRGGQAPLLLEVRREVG
mmetsp:Transcript_3836/g.8952  ORF Transcript_3836/g.8952 Transcript_3836/m.8952 type:complete len:124 (-) Transcript_3836:2504-2875(-)